MSIQEYQDAPDFLRDFLFYLLTIKGRSPKTVEAYYIDLRMFFRFLLQYKHMAPADQPIHEISIDSISLDFVKNITLSDAYAFLNYTLTEADNNAKTRARKVSSLRSFFRYMTAKSHLLEKNPVQELEVPSVKKSLPRYLTLEESLELLNSVEVKDFESARDYCMITLFLNCGMRLSELVGINLSDMKEETLTITGKGNKERVVYLNDACRAAIKTYLAVRPVDGVKDKDALFLSSRKSRISGRRVEQIVEKALQSAGLSAKGYSPHKLRHTAATLMYQHGGVDIRALKEVLGHENIATTEIYTHVSSAQVENAIKSSPLSQVKKGTKKAPQGA